MAREFVLVRLTSMRGVDLDLFDFDYDLTWMAFFLDADERVLGRYGGRDADGPDNRVSLAGLGHAMRQALARHRAGEGLTPEGRHKPPRVVDDLPGAKRLTARACVHCHQVYDFRREALQAQGKWTRDLLWVYPQPENLGLSLDVDRADRVVSVKPGSPAARAGLRAGDRLMSIAGRPVASFAEAQYALHRAPARGTLPLTWERGRGRGMKGEAALEAGWKKTDLSWRWSLRGVDPPPWVHGEDLSALQKKALGLPATALALEQGAFVSEPARLAGLQQGDVVIGIDGKVLHLNGAQLAAHVRLGYEVGDRVRYLVLRGGKRIDVTITLRGRRR